MIVDDEPLEREVLTLMIKKHNLKVNQFFEAENGIDAVKLAKEKQMDLVIMDIKMPKMDGLMAAEIIKKEVSNCRIIFLTAYDEFDFAYQTIKLGADDYLLKPAHPEDIGRALVKFIPMLDTNPIPKGLEEAKHYDIMKIRNYIEHNLHTQLNLEMLSKLVHLNSQYISRLFKRETGFTITQYVTIRRLEKAKFYLDHTKGTVAEISEKCGFFDPNYFTRVFKKYEGKTPTQFQQQTVVGRKKRLNSFNNY
ncbi:response regulator [Aneurinibacillus sp. Ricciae_BoGa-3]|uniref:response regulator transcription factor n=1 Tax=Aneurinibacillus sp. Ricciae_BoGa-3 TaxID=3022697 RepID=UPI002340DA36|nr:response regulator [Aneurinibacillus sp. Ricciae_BoGa-3]WCK56818.1 response regulator [Aneurinibacillus sp. Ricciae_BoGa-3]